MRKKKVYIIFLSCIFIIAAIVIWQCDESNKRKISDLEIEEIENIHLSGWSGGVDGDFERDLSREEKEQFIVLLDEVKLGRRISSKKAAGAGAEVRYTIEKRNGSSILIKPGSYFFVDGAYYKFKNFHDIWGRFVSINSF